MNITSDDLFRAGEIEFEFFLSSGPGGQNVNKVFTAVRLRFDVTHSRILPKGAKDRLIALAGRKVTGEGILVIEGQRFRTRERNRKDTVDRLMGLVERSLVVPKKRRATQPSAASKEKRLESKRRQQTLKRKRRRVTEHDEP